MSSINFTAAIETQQSFIAKILRTTKGGWICSIGDAEVFLPGSQLYKEIDDYESVVGKSVKVMVQRADRNGVVVSHKYYRKYNYERKTILESLERGQKLIGIIKGIVDNGYQIDVLGIIGFMPKDAALNGSLMNIGDNIEFAVLKSDPEKSNLILSAKLLKEIEEANKRKEERELRNRQEEQHRSHFVNYINNEVIPNNLVLIGRVVFIERDLVTIHINYNGSIYSAYIINYCCPIKIGID